MHSSLFLYCFTTTSLFIEKGSSYVLYHGLHRVIATNASLDEPIVEVRDHLSVSYIITSKTHCRNFCYLFKDENCQKERIRIFLQSGLPIVLHRIILHHVQQRVLNDTPQNDSVKPRIDHNPNCCPPVLVSLT